MANWKEYTTKTTPEDADEIMIADSKANVSKRTPFSGLWNWIAGKLATAVISQLETQNKSIIPALNELNSKATSKMIITENLEKEFSNSPSNSISFLQCQNADDNPRKGILTLCINYKTAPAWGFQYVFSYGSIYFRSIGNGTFSDWKQIK